jgi:uncharacterized repeat protein (TIGR01451 family)
MVLAFNLIIRWLLLLLAGLLAFAANSHFAQGQIFDPTGQTIFGARGTRGGVNGPPAFQHPTDPPPCAVPIMPSAVPIHERIRPELPPVLSPVPVENNPRTLYRGRAGAVAIAPETIVAPVGSEVILLGGICGPDGYLVTRQPLEWMLSQESVGNFVDVGQESSALIGHLLSKQPRKLTGGFAKGRTGTEAIQLSRGTPTPGDDVMVQKGQTWVSLTSPSEGTSYVTVLAPEADGWDQRRKTATIHWIDATWSLPPSAVVPSGQAHPVTVRITRPSDGSPVEGWLVRYEVINSNIPVGFTPTGSTQAEVRTNSNGEATVYLRQETAQTLPGQAQVQAQIIRPPFGNTTKPLKVAESISQINWTAPALELVATGPENAGRDTVVSYTVQVTNPGDTPAHDVVVSAEIPEGFEFVSSNPKATLYGHRIEWRLGDLPPRNVPYTMDVQLKANRQGTKRTCFEAASAPDNLKTEACIDTYVSIPCIGLKIVGPSEAKVGEQLTYRIEISNECEEDMNQMKLEVNFDEGFDAPGHTSPMTYGPINTPIPFNETKVVELTLIPKQAGSRCFNLNVTTARGDAATGQKCVNVTSLPEPQVEIAISGPERGDVGKTATYQIRVTNTGNVILRDLDITSQFSDSLEPTFATAGYYWKEDALAWRYRELAPGKSIDLKIVDNLVTADPSAIHLVKVKTADGVSDQDQALTFIQSSERPAGPAEGPTRIPGERAENRLKVGVTALDSVRVGETARFQISVKNDRNVPDQDIGLSLKIPPGLQYVPVGSVQEMGRSDDGSTINLTPRREMRAGEEIRFIVQLRALKPGIHQFRVIGNSALSDGNVEGSDTVEVTQ